MTVVLTIFHNDCRQIRTFMHFTSIHSQSQEILKMEKSYADIADCLHAPDGEGFPTVSINENSCSSPTTQSGEVPCLISKSSLTQTHYYLTEINGDPLCGGEANCNITEEDPLRCTHMYIS